MKLNIKKILLILVTATAFLAGLYVVYAATLTRDLVDYHVDVLRTDHTVLIDGELNLGGSANTGITEYTCNAVPGWHWYVANGREGCWSKNLGVNIHWNSGVGNDVDNPGAYTCAVDVVSLTERMEAASAGEWTKIISSGGVSALSISDCLDRVRDLCTGDGCLGASVDEVNISLANWASDTGDKSALPYCTAGSDCLPVENNDFKVTCEQGSRKDLPLGRFINGVLFQHNQGSLGNNDFIWIAYARNSDSARIVGKFTCSTLTSANTDSIFNEYGFRVVIRP